MKQQIQIGASTLALIALLIYTFVHTGALLARYVSPPVIGYVAALGIETAVVGLSLRIGDMRRAKQKTGFFIFVLIAVVAVSAMANIAEGFYAVNDAVLSVGNLSQLDPIQAIILLAATGLISLIVLALSEIIGTDINTAIKKAEKEQRKHEVAEETKTKPNETPTLAPVLSGKALEIYTLLKAQPGANNTEIGEAVGVSRQYVGKVRKELNGAVNH